MFKNVKLLLVYGIHSVISIIYNDIYKIHKLYYDKHSVNIRIKNFIYKNRFSNIKIKRKSKNYINLLTKFKNNQGIAIKIYFKYNIYNFYKILDNKKNLTFILFNKIYDINNISNSLRSCSLFNCDLIFIINKKKFLNSQFFKVSSGSITPFIFLKNFKKLFFIIKKFNFKVICLNQDYKNDISEINLNFKNLLFLFGSEYKFLSKVFLSEICDIKASVKTIGNIKSLNLSSVVNICLYNRFNRFISEWTGIEPVLSGVTSQNFNH